VRVGSCTVPAFPTGQMGHLNAVIWLKVSQRSHVLPGVSQLVHEHLVCPTIFMYVYREPLNTTNGLYQYFSTCVPRHFEGTHLSTPQH